MSKCSWLIYFIATCGAWWLSGRAQDDDQEVLYIRIPVVPLRNFGNSVDQALCLSDETLKSVGPFYLVPSPGEVKAPASLAKRVTCRGLHHSEKDVKINYVNNTFKMYIN